LKHSAGLWRFVPGQTLSGTTDGILGYALSQGLKKTEKLKILTICEFNDTIMWMNNRH
jgi:hypothetical protein